MTLLLVFFWGLSHPLLPAWAAPGGLERPRLLSWTYDPNRQLLEITTKGVTIPILSTKAGPSRLIMDLPAATLESSNSQQFPTGLVEEIRTAQFTPEIARLVIQLRATEELRPDQYELDNRGFNRWQVQLGQGIPNAAPPPQAPVPSPNPNPVPNPNPAPNPPPPPLASPSLTKQELRSLARFERIDNTEQGFIIRTSGPTDASVRRVDSPDRLIVDLPGTIISTATKERSFAVNRLGIKQIRIGQFQNRPPITRIVLDIDQEVADWETAYDPAVKGVRLVPAGQLAMAQKRAGNLLALRLIGDRLIFVGDGPLQAKIENTGSDYKVNFPGVSLPKQPISGPKLTSNGPLDRLRLFQDPGSEVSAILALGPGIKVIKTESQKNQFVIQFNKGQIGQPTGEGPLVVIDPGHGGTDPGALAGGRNEKTLNIQVAQYLGQILSQKGYRVVFTREDDRYIPLQGRVDIAEQVKANIFVSVHHNASENTGTDGLQTYYIRENSRTLAKIVHRNLIAKVGQPDRGLRTARYYVIRKTTMPAILVEMGYMTNPAELALITQAPHQRLAAESIARALDEYFRK